MTLLSRTIFSARLKPRTLKIYRSNGSWVSGRWVEVENSPPYFTVKGPAYQSSQKELDMMPEGDRVKTAMSFYTPERLYATHNDKNGEGLSDKIEYEDELYKILWASDWLYYGYYLSIAERIMGS